MNEDKNLILSAHNSVWDSQTAVPGEGLIDETNITNMGLDETGFYIVENKDNKIILRYKFNTIIAF